MDPTQRDQCVHCGLPESTHEPSGCCGDGGGSVFVAELENPQRNPIEEADGYRDTMPEDDADALVLAGGEIAWLREAVRRFEAATITVEQQTALAAAAVTTNTPGPWKATEGGPRSNQWTVWADTEALGDLRVAVMPYELIAQAANARLIAAAPELYEALRQLRSNAEIANRHLPQTETAQLVSSALFDTISQADTALAKARGQ